MAGSTIMLRLEAPYDRQEVTAKVTQVLRAIQIVNLISDRGILNEDVKTRSFILQENPGKEFKLCNFLREYGDEAVWRQ